MILALDRLGTEIHQKYEESPPTAAQIAVWKAEIHRFNHQIGPLSKSFSDSLGEAPASSRWH
ncbi:hypothetical protein AJ88_14360 [Mesorhizobium amorphae CCBAU 01583]|nr:hypothetical protein AJ88_14360 [Mesorhizobium amorphae CCBAU 01583]